MSNIKIHNSSTMHSKILELTNTHDITKEQIITKIIDFYNKANDTALNAKQLTYDEEGQLQRWLNKEKVGFIDLRSETFTKMNWFANEFDKHQYFLQFHCKICDIEGLTHFPIRISPMSSQIKSDIKNKFQELIKTAPYVKNKPTHFKDTDRICLKLIFVINKSRDKDVDNMAKITIDGLEKILIPDDKQVDHLEVIKFKTNYLEEHISISIGRSHLNDNKNILFHNTNFKWAGLEKMIVEK